MPSSLKRLRAKEAAKSRWRTGEIGNIEPQEKKQANVNQDEIVTHLNSEISKSIEASQDFNKSSGELLVPTETGKTHSLSDNQNIKEEEENGGQNDYND